MWVIGLIRAHGAQPAGHDRQRHLAVDRNIATKIPNCIRAPALDVLDRAVASPSAQHDAMKATPPTGDDKGDDAERAGGEAGATDQTTEGDDEHGEQRPDLGRHDRADEQAEPAGRARASKRS